MTATAAPAAAAMAMMLAACGSGAASEPAVKTQLLEAVAAIRDNPDYRAVRSKLTRKLARLERLRVTTPDERRAKALALRGLRWAVRGLGAQIEFVENDSGNLPAATEDAKRADRAWKRAAQLLRAAGRALDVEIGLLNGY